MSEQTKPANPVGAPSKYHDGIPKLLTEFFDRPIYTIDETTQEKMPSKLPTIERFCCDIDIVTSTFYKWCKEQPELSSAFNKAKQYQKDQLMQMSLMGIYREGFAKFVAINVTDMKDKIEHDISKDSKEVLLGYQLKPKEKSE